MKYLVIHHMDEAITAPPDSDSVGDPTGDAAEEEVEAWVAGDVLVTDGPFAEAKEQIAGFEVLECASLDEAVQHLSRHPSARIGTLEVREFWAS